MFAAVARRRTATAPARADLLAAGRDAGRPSVARTASRSTRAEEILLRAARDLGLLDLIDPARLGARSSGTSTATGWRPCWRVAAPRRTDAPRGLAPRRPGKRVGRRDACCRLFHRVDGGAGRARRSRSYDDDGPADRRGPTCCVIGTPFLHEYDGAHHRGKDQHRRSTCAGSAALARLVVRPPGLHARRPAQPSRRSSCTRSTRALGRPHDLGRLRRWRRLVDNSLYSERRPRPGHEPLAAARRASSIGQDPHELGADVLRLVTKPRTGRCAEQVPSEMPDAAPRLSTWTGGSSGSRTSTASRARSRASAG